MSTACTSPPRSGGSSATNAPSRIKLRLYYGGKFAKAPGSSEWRYVGGSCFNDAVPSTYRYSDLARKLNDKFCDTVSFKYVSPGEELDPDALVAVTDDDDLEELYEEYFSALRRPGTPLKTFRVKVYVFPALQFETMYAAPDTDDVEASMQEGNTGPGSGGINFESWCSDDVSLDSSQRSYGFGAAVEMQASADNAFLQALHQHADTLASAQLADRPGTFHGHPHAHPHGHPHFPTFPQHLPPLAAGSMAYNPVPHFPTFPMPSHHAVAAPAVMGTGVPPVGRGGGRAAASNVGAPAPAPQHAGAHGMLTRMGEGPGVQQPMDACPPLHQQHQQQAEGGQRRHPQLPVTPPTAHLAAADVAAAGAGAAMRTSPSYTQLDALQLPTPRAAGAWMPVLEHHALDNISKSVQIRHFLRGGDVVDDPGVGEQSSIPAAAAATSAAGPLEWGARHQVADGGVLLPGGYDVPTPPAAAEAAAFNREQLSHQQEHEPEVFDFAGYRRQGFTADDFTLDDPYHEDGGSLNGGVSSVQGEGCQLPQQKERERQLWMDLMSDKDAGEQSPSKAPPRARDSAANLALHIQQLGGSLLGGGSSGTAGAAAGESPAACAASKDCCAPPGSTSVIHTAQGGSSNTSRLDSPAFSMNMNGGSRHDDALHNNNSSHNNNNNNNSDNNDNDNTGNGNSSQQSNKSSPSGDGACHPQTASTAAPSKGHNPLNSSTATAKNQYYDRQHGLRNGGSRLGTLLRDEPGADATDGAANAGIGGKPIPWDNALEGQCSARSAMHGWLHPMGTGACAMGSGPVAGGSGSSGTMGRAAAAAAAAAAASQAGAGSSHSHARNSLRVQSLGWGCAMGGGLDLPSHISAFGEGLEEEPQGCDVEEACEAERQRLQLMYGDIDVSIEEGPHRLGSKCITQEFSDQDGRYPSQDSPLPPVGRSNKAKPLDAARRNNGDLADLSPLVMPLNLLAGVTHVPLDQVTVTMKIGEGAFGEVSRAEVFPYGTVAIKWLKRDRFTKHSQSFMREAEVLARLNHPNIIRMFGLVTEPSPASSPGGSSSSSIIAGIMMEHVRGGSLSQRLRLHAQACQPFTLRERCLIALQAALGMAYLHDQHPAVIHFDLKPDNLLVEREGQDVLVKVADFGLSKAKFQNFVTCHDLRGTLPYMAPELVANPTQVCEKCDVWSMGVCMWEMWTLKVPFYDLSAQQILVGLMHGTLHLPLSRSCEPEWSHLIKSCMEPDPMCRPTFKQLATQIRNMLKFIGPCAEDPVHEISSKGGGNNNALGKLVRV